MGDMQEDCIQYRCGNVSRGVVCDGVIMSVRVVIQVFCLHTVN